MSFDERIRAVRETDARLNREREESAQKDRERYEARTALKETWEKVTTAIVQSGLPPDVQVATIEGIARGNEVNKRRPQTRVIEPFFRFNSPSVYLVPREVHEAWNRAVLDAVGSLVQPAWDMDSYIVLQGSYGYTHSHTGDAKNRLFLAQDATIYRSGVVHPMRYSEAGYHYYPISSCLELRDDVYGAIETALATLVVRRELNIVRGAG